MIYYEDRPKIFLVLNIVVNITIIVYNSAACKMDNN